MSNEKASEVIASMVSLYSVMKYFSVLYDKLYVEIKLYQTLADPNKSRELKKCFEMFVKDLDRWHCILRAIGAEDIWEKYKGVWAKMG
jgi:hypothetical protein